MQPEPPFSFLQSVLILICTAKKLPSNRPAILSSHFQSLRCSAGQDSHSHCTIFCGVIRSATASQARPMIPETGERRLTSLTACQVCGTGSRCMQIHLLKTSFPRSVIHENRASVVVSTCQRYRSSPTLIFEPR